MALELGLRGEATMAVTAENTALAHGSGDVDVLSTPAL
ncbi:MAG: thioesterase, partial [Acidimicrobiales bacterium]|nr:thioesterase [Acidimicrobiales bacterium]